MVHRGTEWKQRAQDQACVDSLILRIRDPIDDGRLGVTVRENVPCTLSGETATLEIWLRDQIVEYIHHYGIGLQESRHEDCFKSKLGTSGATVPVIDTPKQHGEQEADAPRFDHYDFIGTSAEIFKETKNLLGAQANCLSFGLLDVETDPIEQGFEAKMYDLIIASNVFHATKTLDCLLANIRKLLRPRVNSFYLK